MDGRPHLRQTPVRHPGRPVPGVWGERLPGDAGRTHPAYRFQARIAIDPADAPAWAARVKPTRPPVGSSGASNPLGFLGGTRYGLAAGEFDGAAWYDPSGLFAKNAHRHYRGGYMAITADRSAVVVWQHWR